MKRNYLLVLVITLLSFNVSALNNENKNNIACNKSIDEYSEQSETKKYSTYSFTDAKGLRWKFQEVEPFSVDKNSNVVHNFKIFCNGQFVAFGDGSPFPGLKKVVKFRGWVVRGGGSYEKNYAKICFRLSDGGLYFNYFIDDEICFANDGYVYPNLGIFEQGTRHDRLQYSTYSN